MWQTTDCVRRLSVKTCKMWRLFWKISWGWSCCAGRVGTKEIDFVAEKQGNKLYVQVCYLLGGESTIRREFGSLLEIRDNYPKLVLYQEGPFRGNYEGIPAVRIEDWLMGEDGI